MLMFWTGRIEPFQWKSISIGLGGGKTEVFFFGKKVMSQNSGLPFALVQASPSVCCFVFLSSSVLPRFFFDWKWVGGRRKLYEEFINQGFFDVCNVGDVCTLHEVKTMT